MQGSDEVLTDLRETYEPEYILYLDTESRKLAEAGQSKEAVSMLEEAKPLVDDSQAVTALILDIQSGVTGGDYILPDSNSRYLTESDIQYLSIREIIMQKMKFMHDMEGDFSPRNYKIILTVNPGIEEP